MPIANNIQMYADDYPSYYYKNGAHGDSTGLHESTLNRFQCIAESDRGVDSLLHWLEQHGELDNTMVIYCSDNGHMLWEHYLFGKQYFLEESARLPLFIRYPAWFSPGLTITDQIASNIDFAPTFLDLAGIENTYGFYGLSLKKLANHETERQKFFYEFGPEDNIPVLRGVRRLTGKYIFSYCSSTTEEYYDLVNDPKENTNQINNPAYQPMIAQYRFWLDSLRQFYGDTIAQPTRNCSLKNLSPPKLESFEPVNVSSIEVFPNPMMDILR